jgi:hypothetical protein
MTDRPEPCPELDSYTRSSKRDDAGKYVPTCLSLPGCYSQGRTIDGTPYTSVKRSSFAWRTPSRVRRSGLVGRAPRGDC